MLDATVAGSSSQRWPPGALENVELLLTNLQQQFASELTPAERQTLKRVGLAVQERAAAS